MVRLSDLLKQLGEDPVRAKQREETLKSFDDLCFSTFAELLHKFMHCTEVQFETTDLMENFQTELEKPKKDGMALGEKEKEGQSFMSKVPNAIVPSWHPPIAVNLPYSQPWLIELIQRVCFNYTLIKALLQEAASMPETPVNGRKGRKRQVRDDPPVRKREPRQASFTLGLVIFLYRRAATSLLNIATPRLACTSREWLVFLQ